MAKRQFLDFEIHLNDAKRVEALQANPFSVITNEDHSGITVQDGKTYLVASPDKVAEELANEPLGDGTPIPFFSVIGGPPFTGTPLTGVKPPAGLRSYLYSAWFTATSPAWSKNFPTDVPVFRRSSGGWFGLPFLFPKTTEYWWRALFVYDAPLGGDDQPAGGPTAIAQRIWLDPFPANGGATPANPQSPEQDYHLTRDAAAQVDTLGLGIRGNTGGMGTRQHVLTDFTGGGASTDNLVWERLYFRWRKAGLTEVLVWQAQNSAGAFTRVELLLTPTGQLRVVGYDAANVAVSIGSTSPPLTLGQLTRLDFISRQGINGGSGTSVGGQLWIYINGVASLTAAFAAGSGFNNIGFHSRSQIGTGDTSGFTAEYDIGFWMGARIPFVLSPGSPALKVPVITGTDWVTGSRAVLVRASGDDPSRAGWAGDWRTLGGLFPRPNNTGNPEALTSSTALARLAVTTDVRRSINSLPGVQGVAALIVSMHGWKGTNNGRVGMVLNGGADQWKVLGPPDTNSVEGSSVGVRHWGHAMFAFFGSPTPQQIDSLVLLREKGNDAVQSGTDHLSACVEVLGTFHNCDYNPKTPVAIREEKPFFGPHNAPYPTTPWANNAAPPLSPVILKSGSYAGNGVSQDLFFKAPVHWLWIQRTTNTGTSPVQARWFSTMLGAGLGGRKSPEPWGVPIQQIDPSFTVVATDNAPSGTGPFPDRSAEVAAIVNANLSLLPDSKSDLCQLVARQLNATIPADGNNWGRLQKNDQGGKIADDILVWKPTMDHVDVLTDSGPTWGPHGVITNPSWVWLQVSDEGQQEQQTVIRIAGAGPEVNQAGETYNYVAVSDPGMRFMLNGAMTHADGVLPLAHSLISANFTPKGAFYYDQRPGTDTTLEMGYKGVGHAASEVTKLNTSGTTTASALTFGAGVLTLGASLSPAADTHLVYNLWRTDDSSGDPGVARVVQIGTYNGNGVNPRNIPFPVTSGKRPLWAMVVPRGAKAWLRHPGHSGGNSSGIDGQHLTTAIIGGGVDFITVQSLLNVNAAVYDFFILVGGDVAGNDGFSAEGEFVPVEPTSPPGGGIFGEDPEEPTEGGPVDEGGVGGDQPGEPGGGDDDILTDLDTDCIPFTKRIFNDALSRIGISKRVVNPSTDTTEEANLCRQHYARAIEQTLRDFPWPFATRYANLTLLLGSPASPANRDWTYAYERPSDCVFERRLAVVRSGAVDPTPPPFQLSFDDTLDVGRIFTNESPAQLEYTARPACTASRGDPLFLDALTWRLASRIAGPLTRIDNVIKLCLDQYDQKIARALEVLRPGNPGPRTTVDPASYDIGPGAAQANVSAVNRAFIRLGVRTIANLATEQSREGEAVRVLFEEELRSVLRDYPWAFCTRYLEFDATLLVAGTTALPPTPANADWQYSYRLPVDCVKVRRICTGNGRHWNENPEMFRAASDATGTLLYTNLVDPKIEYTARIPDCVLRGDALFRDAFAWRLAASLAPSLATIDPQETEQLGRGPQDRPRERKPTEGQLRERAAAYAWAHYYRTIEKARIADAMEQQQDPFTGDAPWITGRN